ncbi:MAG: hypothetical protein ACI94Y_000511 [Maribacter sp.]|jgi:hypothetical protein
MLFYNSMFHNQLISYLELRDASYLKQLLLPYHYNDLAEH